MRRRFTSRYLAAHYPAVYKHFREMARSPNMYEHVSSKSPLGLELIRLLESIGIDTYEPFSHDFDDMGNIIIEQ